MTVIDDTDPLHEPAPRDNSTAYRLRGITHLPHYSRRGEFVSPGFGKEHMDRHTAPQLVAMGASPVTLMLWPRGKRRVQ